MPYYAVKKGVRTGIFESWADIKPLVQGFFGAKYRKFDTLDDAKAFMGETGGSILDNRVEAKDPVDIEKDDELIVFCDGACCANGKASAKAGYSIVWPFHEEFNGAWKLEGEPKTNNRAELMGIVKSFEVADMIDAMGCAVGGGEEGKKRKLIIYTDSMLVVNSLNTWMKKWEKNNWKKSDGEQVLNQDLLMRIKELQKKRDSDIRHVRAHTGRTDFWSVNNDKADKLARGVV